MYESGVQIPKPSRFAAPKYFDEKVRTTTPSSAAPDVAVNFSDDELNNIDISSIPSYIKYTASGVNPSFYSNNIEFIVNN